ncbi:MAG: ATP-binding cassette domain-containing protein [Dehalococcoidia bacterium]|nr:ATP-binding cassette domain-containing protein [Dehalococcoidia bacterium]
MKTSPNAAQPVYVLEGVTKTYPAARALDAIDLTISPGERVAVLGPSGSGKTSLLHVMGGVVPPDTGTATIEGQPLTGLSAGRELAGMVGMIHQQYDLVPHLPVIHNVLAGRLGRWSTMRSLLSLVLPQERNLAVDALEILGISDKINERTSRLSGGEQQRVAMARLLVQAPRVILADEPVASLDPARAEALMLLLNDVADRSNNTVVASLHSVHLTRKYFSRAIGLRRGRMHFDVPVDLLDDGLLNDLYDIEGLDGET